MIVLSQANLTTNELDMSTVHPAPPKMTDSLRKLHKYGEKLNGDKIRWFSLDDDNLSQFKNETDKWASKVTTLQGSQALFEIKPKSGGRWEDNECSARVQIKLRHNKKQKIVYVYSRDYNFLKYLVVRIKIGSTPKLKTELKEVVLRISTVYSVMKFESFFKQMIQLHQKRIKQLVQFQVMGLNLVDVAGLAWQRNRKVMLNISHQLKPKIKNSEDVQCIRSTFKHGLIRTKNIHQIRMNEVVLPACLVNKYISKLVTMIRNRRQQRTFQVQNEIENLCEQFHNGQTVQSVSLNHFQRKMNPIIGALIYLERDNLIIEDINPQNLKKSINQLLSLSSISFIATDLINDKLKPDQMLQQKDYTIEIYGPIIPKILKSELYAAPEMCFLSTLNQQDKEYYKIQVKQISLPWEFIKKYNNKCTIKVKLSQVQQSKPEREFYLFSDDIQLHVKDIGKLVHQVLDIQTDITFNVNKIVGASDEKFTFSIMYIYQNQPVSKVIRDYVMCGNRSGFNKNRTLIDYSDTLVPKKVNLQSDIIQGQITLNYTVQNQKYTNQKLNFREGKRLLVGKYCLYLNDVGKWEQCQVQSYNLDDTVYLRHALTHNLIESGKKIPINKIKLIEKYGVSVYNLFSIPEQLKESQWKLTIKTQDKRLVNSIQSAIQYHQVYSLNQNKLKNSDAVQSGQVLCNLISIKELYRSPIIEQLKIKQLKPFVKLSISNKKCIGKIHASDVIGEIHEDIVEDHQNDVTKIASWVNENYALGQQFNLGFFSNDLNDPPILKLEVFHKNGKQNELLGSAQFNTSVLFNSEQQAQELTLLLQIGKDTAGVINIMTRFMPDQVTRFNYSQVQMPVKLYQPEAMLHFMSIMKPHVTDRYNYSVPIGNYNWKSYTSGKYMDWVINHQRPLILKGMTEWQSFMRQMMIQQENKIHRSLTGMNATIKLWLTKGIFMSKDAIIDIQIWIMNQRRPMFQQFQIDLWNTWHVQKVVAAQNAKIQLATHHWTTFMDNIDHPKLQFSETQINEKGDSLTGAVKHMHAKLMSDTNSKKQNQEVLLYNKDIGKLLFAGIWAQSKNDQEKGYYRDLYDLIHKFGIPDELRSKIWRELLKVQVLEYEEVQYYQKQIAKIDWNPKKTVFTNFLEYSEKYECLGFLQVDEDVASYVFPKGYLSELPIKQCRAQMLQERRSIRQVLRILVLWSRHKKVEGKDLSYSYDMGTIEIIQRLLTIKNSNVEQTFWILVGLIRLFPRPFSISESIMQGDCRTIMRYEFIAFKAIIEQNLPKLFQKLKQIGLPLEILVYKPIMSMYSTFFSSDIVLRLWDLIFFSFSTMDQDLRKVGLWYLLAPSYLIFQRQEQLFLEARTCEDVVKAFENGSTLWYDPSDFIKELNVTIQKLFIEEKTVVNQNAVSEFIFGESVKFGNINAFEMEEKRRLYQERTKQLFSMVIAENIQVKELMHTQQVDELLLRKTLIEQFTEIAQPQQQDLEQIHVFIHGLTKMPACKESKYAVQISYGKSKKNEFETFKIGDQKPTESSNLNNSGQIYKTESIETYTKFIYKTGWDFIKIDIFEGSIKGKQISDALINLSHIEQNRVKSHRQILRNIVNINQPENFIFSSDQIYLSFYLQSKGQFQNVVRDNIIASVRKPSLCVLDFFNRTQYRDLTQNFVEQVKSEYEGLNNFVSRDQSLDIINDKFNYVDNQEYGVISQDEFIRVSNLLLPKQILGDQLKLEKVYKQFTNQPLSNVLSKEEIMQKLELASIRRLSFLGVIASIDSNSKEITAKPINESIPFNLRKFFASIVLHSLSTLEQKLSLLYDLFQISENVVRLKHIYQLISIIFDRSQFFMDKQELLNLCQYVFQGSVSMVSKAYWTKDPKTIKDSIVPKISIADLQKKDHLIANIEVTQQIESSFINYFNVVGNKFIDFNPDTSPFAQLKDLVGESEAKTLLAYSKSGQYQICMIIVGNGEHFCFNVHYDSNGQLVNAGSAIGHKQKVSNIADYFERQSGYLHIDDYGYQVSKQEFFAKLEQIPMLASLTRVETFYQDRILKSLQPRKLIQTPVVVQLVLHSILYKFEFSTSFTQSDQEGKNFETINQVYIIKMNGLFESTILQEIQDRIIDAYKVLCQYVPVLNEDNQTISGEREWCVYQNKEWTKVNDFHRICNMPKAFDCIALKLRNIHRKMQEMKHDCLSLYKHSDESYEWRPCRIIRKEKSQNHLFEVLEYIFIIEFQHQAHMGEYMWMKRQASEIIFSADYTRYNTKNFEREALDFLIQLYKVK